jgi:hypothetical protein
MVWLPATLFLTLFVYVHARDPRLADRPLSELRDGPWWVAGYALFALLAVAGVGQTLARHRAGGGRAAFLPGVGVALLPAVALSPTQDVRHGMASFLLIGLVFAHFARELYLAGSLWFWAHLIAPAVVLAWAADSPTYGRIQKGLILYFVLAVTLDWLAVTGRLRLPGPDALRLPPKKRRAVAYRPRVEWRRTDGRPDRRPAGSSV